MNIQVLGELSVVGDNGPADLPPSKKTRALLAYLALTGRPHRRERLCEMFWDLPDDPRASLRWALSKIRNLIDSDEVVRVIADRERVAISRDRLQIDYVDISRRLAEHNAPIRLGELQRIAHRPRAAAAGRPRSAASGSFQAWLTSEREEAQRLRQEVLQRIVNHPDVGEQDSLKWARMWQSADPHSTAAANAVARSLRANGRPTDADEPCKRIAARWSKPA